MPNASGEWRGERRRRCLLDEERLDCRQRGAAVARRGPRYPVDRRHSSFATRNLIESVPTSTSRPISPSFPTLHRLVIRRGVTRSVRPWWLVSGFSRTGRGSWTSTRGSLWRERRWREPYCGSPLSYWHSQPMPALVSRSRPRALAARSRSVGTGRAGRGRDADEHQHESDVDDPYRRAWSVPAAVGAVGDDDLHVVAAASRTSAVT